MRQLAEIMRGLRAHGHSILLVEQNVDLALAVADYVYVLTTGRVAHEGPIAEVARGPEALGQHLGI